MWRLYIILIPDDSSLLSYILDKLIRILDKSWEYLLKKLNNYSILSSVYRETSRVVGYFKDICEKYLLNEYP